MGEAKDVQGEGKDEKNNAFLSFSELQPILGEAKDVQGERKDGKNNAFLSFSETQPAIRGGQLRMSATQRRYIF